MGVGWKGRTVFLIYCDIEAKYEEEFNAFYDTEHLRDLLKMPGFLDGARYVAESGAPKYLAIYEMTGLDALDTQEFKLHATRRTPWAERISVASIGKNIVRLVATEIYPNTLERPDRGMAPALRIGRNSIPQGFEKEWAAWYHGEHLPAMSKVPGVIAARSFRVDKGDVGHVVIYEMENAKVSESEAWKKHSAGSMPANGSLRSATAQAPGSPGVYRRIFPR